MENRAREKNIIIAFFVICLLILLGRLVFLQLVNKEYKVTASNNVLRYEIIYPSRGLIYDRNGDIMVGNQSAYDIMITPREVEPFDTTGFCSIFHLSREQMDEMLAQIDSRRRAIGYQSVIFLRQVSKEQYTRFLEKAHRFPGFSVQTRSVRNYPTAICGNMLGYIIEADASFLEKNKEYRLGDYIGRTGLEEYYESWLKGEKGYSIYLRDVHNQIRSSYEEGAYDKPAAPGKNMITSIDLPLQVFGEELMKNKVGSVIALDPSSGEILTLITSTGLSSEYLTNFGAYYSQVITDPLKPMFNRAIMSSYPPGSVFKLVNGLIGLQEGVVTPNTRYSCNMGYRAGSLTVGCHSHPSPLNLMQSVMMSCNAYYCNVFRNILDNPEYENTAMAMDYWQEYVKSFGFGQKLGIDLPGELSGSIPGTATYNRIYGKNGWKSLTVISLAIGQGEIGATPLQLANLAAVMANRGYYYTPHLVREIPEDPEFSPAVERHQVMVDSANFSVIVEGMYQAVHGPAGSGATARLAAIPGVEMCGKTGTAQNPHGEDHSVFICFAPRENPKIAVAVYIEQGGFGASQAAPVASLLVEKYLTGEIHPSRQWLYERTLEQDLLTRHLE
ncbi:MAG TPA: penicillin-binding transpeptidase domain-containing protein [Bacteroidales bacterium]|nr:penicillin-binding transpeptidase domain-containing protein [Bacteroidales bacterium]HRW95414.1 penicillin-binding transpeptidase domain-containing protein [Bacteroidales bacterium]